ncbi:CMT1A duplicated region transcript 4 protein [Delphinapterus leucas]|uniref:CMT1A duplicated region transcript 4 protein n=1 Tax=Delphinapterus leucas TaxID=9749 RepID=A0A2Y9M681_DELLE|nr:CMT1A duplicated region transcript 4 protein [Delphinapterus leucas]
MELSAWRQFDTRIREEEPRERQAAALSCEIKEDPKKPAQELTENIGLPVNLLEKHDLWPAYVTYTSPLVKRLIEKSKARDVERLQTAEESWPTYRQSKPPSVTQLERRKSFTSSGNMTFEDVRSETTLSAWGPFSMSDTGPPVVPERTHFHSDARASPTADYNKIIFSQKPRTRVLPYHSLLAGEEKHPDI